MHCKLYHKNDIGMKELSKIIDNNRETIAIVIGNGINYYFGRGKVVSWNKLLEELWKQYAKDDNTDFIKEKGLSYTELYDIIELKYNKAQKEQECESFKKSIDSVVKSINEESDLTQVHFTEPCKLSSTKNDHSTLSYNEMEQAEALTNQVSRNVVNVLNSHGLFPNSSGSFESMCAAMDIASGGVLSRLLFLKKHISEKFKNAILDKEALSLLCYAQKEGIPILTTNYDHAIENLLKLQEYQLPKHDCNQHLYPVSTYFSDKPLINATDGFGIWHINGMVGYQNSIRLGLCDYMDLVQYLRGLMQINRDYGMESFVALNCKEWVGKQTWLDIIFKKSLFIFGLGLNEDEVPLRWLLLQRERYNSMFNRGLKGWYVALKKDEVSANKRLFFENVGINIVQVDNYQILYEDLWKNLSNKW